MGYLLQNDKEDYQLTIWYWHPLLELAIKNGWDHPGTLRPKDYPQEKNWDGNYWHNSGQIVTKKDALNLAAALTKSLDSLPTEEVYVKMGFDMTDEERVQYKNTPPESFFSGPNKETVKEFAEFCRKGSFKIY